MSITKDIARSICAQLAREGWDTKHLTVSAIMTVAACRIAGDGDYTKAHLLPLYKANGRTYCRLLEAIAREGIA